MVDLYSAIIDARLAIELSHERRAALNTAAVTGQIDMGRVSHEEVSS